MALKPIKVSQVNNYIKRILQTDPILGNISVTGEISNLKFHGSGHVYLSLKDESSKINCFLPRENLDLISFTMEEGMEVVVTGYIYTHVRTGAYSINIRTMELAGRGQLAIAFEQLKAKLEKEGLFDKAHKKPIPVFPHKVAIVTSETGAAVKDILKIIKNKNNYVDVIIYPVLVQGPGAAAEIAAAITDINNSYSDVDVIITGRGGGSYEELWAFNEEVVARSIYASQIPVISAVGHEIDFTIADFVADLRAETPTAAAEQAVPDTAVLHEYINDMVVQLKRNLRSLTEVKRTQLELRDPQRCRRELENRIIVEQMRTDAMMEEMEQHVKSILVKKSHRLEVLKEILEGRNPKSILKKGYSIVTDQKGEIVKDASLLEQEEIVRIQSYEGYAKAKVTETGKE